MSASGSMRIPTVRSFAVRASALVLAGALALAGCETARNAPKQTAGAVVGGAAGAVVGAQFGSGTGQLAATALGTIVGALLGSEVGKSLDRADQTYHSRAAQQALEDAPTGTPVSWRNPDSGHSGYVEPVRTYEPSPGYYCREYQQVIVVGGREERAYGTACRQPDGSWRIQNS